MLILSWARFRGHCAFLVVLAVAAAGCSHSRDLANEGAFTAARSPVPPPFLAGPVALLLTNASGYSARLEAQTDSFVEQERLVSGQFLCQGSRLLFAPDAAKGSKHNLREGGYSFIWDAASNTGYVLSEELQAYAPVSSSLRATNIEVRQLGGAQETVQGHACVAQQVIMRLNNGTTATFSLLRAPDLNACPLHISSGTNAIPLTVALSKVDLVPPPAELFAPPDGFAKYESAQAMSDEIAARRVNFRRKLPKESSPSYQSPSQPAGGFRAY